METCIFLLEIIKISSRKCVYNCDIRMKKHENLTFRLILRKKILGPPRFEPTEKIPVNRISHQLNKISLLSFFLGS